MKKYIKPAVFILIIIAVLVLNHIYGWSDYLGDPEEYSFLMDTVKENPVKAVTIYCILTIIACVVLALPGITFAVIAGLLFGPWLGTLFCLIATTFGAVAAFIVGRFFLKDSLKPMIVKNRYLNRLLFEEAGKSDLVVLMITRLVPLFPYNLQNFAYGITDISLGSYTLYTFIFMFPGVAMLTIASAGIMAESNRIIYFVSAAVLLVLVVFLGRFVRNKYLDK